MDALKLTIGVTTILLSIAGHIPYISDVLKNKTKPHAYTWFIWTVLTGLTCIAQLREGAAAGAWTTGTTAIMALVIFGLSFKHGSHDITKADTWCLAGALVALGFWLIARQPLLAVILATAVDVLAFIPTVRKSLNRPEQETFVTYLLAVIRNGLAVFAMNAYNIVTLLYPLSLFAMNIGMSVVLLVKDHLQPKKLFR